MVAPEAITERPTYRPPRPPRSGFTAKYIESLRAAERPYELADPGAKGLVLRVNRSGVKSFRWYVKSLKRVVTIGAWAITETPAHVTLREAREWLGRLKEARRAGDAQLDLVESRLREQLEPARRPAQETGAEGTVDAIAESFLKMLDGRRKRPGQARYVYEKDIAPVIGHIPLRDLKKSDCRLVVERVVSRDAKVWAGKVLGLLKQLLDYAENVEDDFVNPAGRLKATNLGVENNIRDRWLSESEIPLFWRALERVGAPEREAQRQKTRAALRLLLLTAVRTQELRLARWTEVDLESALWTVPVENQKLTKEQAKKAKPFVVPLSAGAVALFRELKGLAGDSPWVLASEESRTGCYTEKALARAMRRVWLAHVELAKLPLASPHDLRRTCRTWLGNLGVQPHIAERCLNHSIGRIQKTYDHGDYLPERRAALEKWAAFVERLVSPEQSNVAFLPNVGS